jgi:hypothetical protein
MIASPWIDCDAIKVGYLMAFFKGDGCAHVEIEEDIENSGADAVCSTYS